MPSRFDLGELSAEQQGALLQNVLDALIVTDSQGNIIFMNSAALDLYSFERLTAHQRENIHLQRYIRQAFILTTREGEVVPEEEWPLTRALQGQPFEDVELRLRHREGGEERVFAFSGTRLEGDPPLGVLTIRDITEIRKAEQRYRIAFEANSAPTLIARLDDGVFVEANEGFTELTGLTEEEATGRSLVDFGLLGEHDDLQRVLADLRAGRQLPRQRVTITHTGAKGRMVLMAARPIEVHARACGIFSFIDITELEQANREIDSFTYSVSHDLRTPLRGIDGFSQLLLEEYRDVLDELGRHYLERVRAAAQHLGKLIDALLVISRLSRTKLRFVQVDLSAITREVLEELRQRSPERNVEVIVASDLIVHGDLRLLQQAMGQLLENAWKFTRGIRDARIEVSREADEAGRLVVCVRDNGVGFDPRYANKLFAAFGKLHAVEQFEGEGIGLAIVQRVIHRHGGQVWAEGSAGQGASFCFTLPANSKPFPETASEPKS